MKIPDILTDRLPRFSKGNLLFVAPFAVAAAGVAGARYALRRFTQRPLPQVNGRLQISGLSQPVEIIRDRWGIPHIYAQNNHDLFFAQGYVHAQDRLFHLDMNRRVGLGRMAEVLGPLGVTTDRFARIMGWPKAAQATVDGTDPVTAEWMTAYANGINAYIAAGRLPVEFALLAYKPEPWELVHTTAWGVVLGWGLSVNWETELMRALLIDRLGPEKAADLMPTCQPGYPAILPDAAVGAQLAAQLLQAFREFSEAFPVGVFPGGPNVGSNNWVIGGQRTVNGRPILANDPHLPPVFPTIWYENHLHGGDFHVTGFTMPGVPGVVIGHNEHIAWGVTNAFPDVQDVYVEKFHPDDDTLYEVNGRYQQAEIVEETIKIRGLRSQHLRVRFTRHGPIITDLLPDEKRPLALRWTGYETNNHIRAVFDINKATDWQSFQDGLRHWGFPSQNIVYADIQGHIGYTMPGKVPRRRRGQGLVPVPGWIDDYEWDGWISHEELPRRFGPPEGYIATANNMVAGDSYPHFLTGEWLAPYRVQRIMELIEGKQKLTIADNAQMHQDTVSLLARRALPLLLAALPPFEQLSPLLADIVGRLRIWPGEMGVDSVEASIFTGWMVMLTNSVLKQAVGEELAHLLLGDGPVEGFTGYPFHKVAYEIVVRWLESGPPAWVGNVTPLVLPALEASLSVLQTAYGRSPEGWQWGKLHYLNLHNHLARIPALGQMWKPVTVPMGGDGYTLNNADVSPHFPPPPVKLIASCRMILDVGEWDNSLAALPGGQSAHLASPYYQNGVSEWVDGRYHPMLFTRTRIESVTLGTLTLEPR